LKKSVRPAISACPAAAEVEEVLGVEGEFVGTVRKEACVAGLLVPGAQRFMEHRERRVEERVRVARDQHDAVGEALAEVAEVPAHRSREERDEQHVNLAAGAAGMAALPVVQHDVDALVDDVLQLFPVGKGRLHLGGRGWVLQRGRHGRKSRKSYQDDPAEGPRPAHPG
jgi:hypothetical protein